MNYDFKCKDCGAPLGPMSGLCLDKCYEHKPLSFDPNYQQKMLNNHIMGTGTVYPSPTLKPMSESIIQTGLKMEAGKRYKVTVRDSLNPTGCYTTLIRHADDQEIDITVTLEEI